MDKRQKLLELKERGFFEELSNEKFLTEEPMTFYLGIDSTAKGIHIGHFIPIKLALELIDLGYKFILLLGGFTGQIGDPTGKTTTRLSLSEDITHSNSLGIKQDLDMIFKNRDILYVNNNDWLKNMNLSEYLEYSSKVSLSKILGLTTIEKRLKENNPLSMKEVSYCLLQGIDHVQLLSKYNCKLQIGGGDQWGNISFSVHLASKYSEAYGICTPLLVDNSGKKISKTDENISFIKPENIWNFCYNLSDDITIKMFKLFCGLNIPKILKDARLEICKSLILMYYQDLDVFYKTQEKMTNLFNEEKLNYINIQKFNLMEIIEFLRNEKLLNYSLFEINNAKNSSGIYLDGKVITDLNIELNSGSHILKIGKKNIFPINIIKD